MDKGVVSAAALELLKTELQTHRRNLALICGRGTSTGPISRGQAAPDAASVPAATLSAQPGKTGNPGQQQAAGQATAKEVAAALGDVAAAAYLAVLSTTRGELRGAVEADIGTCDQAPRASSAASDPALMQRPKAPAAGSSRDQSATTASGGRVRDAMKALRGTTAAVAAAAATPQQGPPRRAAGHARPCGAETRQAPPPSGANLETATAATDEAASSSMGSGRGPTRSAAATAKSKQQRPEWIGIRNIPTLPDRTGPECCYVRADSRALACVHDIKTTGSTINRAAGATGTSGILGRTPAAPGAMRSLSAPRRRVCSEDGAAQERRQDHEAGPAASRPLAAAAEPCTRQTASTAATGAVKQQVICSPDSASAGDEPLIPRSSTAREATCPNLPSGATRHFPALERTMLRRQRLASLLSRTRVASADGAASDAAQAESSAPDAAGMCARALARRAGGAALADMGIGALAPPSGPGAGALTVGPDVLWSRGPAGGLPSDGLGDLKAHAREAGSVGLAAGSGGGGRGSATSVIVSSQNVARLGVAAAAADLPLVAATDAYAALRAWRAKRAWAAAVICGAARRYLDRRSRAQSRRALTAAAQLGTSKMSRILARWRAAATARGLLRRRYAGLGLLSAEARRVAAEALLADLASHGPTEEHETGAVPAEESGQDALNLRALSPALAEALAWLCYSPAAASVAGGGCCEALRFGGFGLVRGDRGWGSSMATSHRQFCRGGLVEGGAFGKALAHRRWWLLRAAWYGLVLEAVAPLPESGQCF